MPLSLKTRQVMGVTLIVGLSVAALSAIHLASIARTNLEESLARGELVARVIIQQAFVAVREEDPAGTLKADPAIRSLVASTMAFSPNVTYVAVTDPANLAYVHSTPVVEGQVVPLQPLLSDLVKADPMSQVRAIYSDRTFEVRERLFVNDETLGSIRVGLSMLLVRQEFQRALLPAVGTLLGALAVAMAGATIFANWIIRPIAQVTTGLSRLGRGEMDVKLELPPGEEFATLGRSFEAVSAELVSARSKLAGQPAHFESIAERLEDAVAIISPAGELLFSNTAMRQTLGAEPTRGRITGWLPEAHPYRRILESALTTRRSQGPLSVELQIDEGEGIEHLVTAHAIEGASGAFVGVMLVARNVAYLGQVQSTLKYSRKLAALGRLLAGVAHEVKNPLNAMTIHLELLKQKLTGNVVTRRRPGVAAAPAAPAAAVAAPPPPSPAPDAAAAMQHVTVIGQEIRRLDEVVQGFLRFSRPEELVLQPVDLRALVVDVAAVIGPDAEGRGIAVENRCPDDLPSVNGDAAMLRQSVLNLALNACEAMTEGGTLTFGGRSLAGGLVELTVSDTGIGISEENLEKVFDLYFTTRQGGSGIGLSMVYRTIHLHDGTIEVASVVGKGTTFTVTLPQA